MVDEKWNEMDITARDAESARRFCVEKIVREEGSKITDIVDYAKSLIFQ